MKNNLTILVLSIILIAVIIIPTINEIDARHEADDDKPGIIYDESINFYSFDAVTQNSPLVVNDIITLEGSNDFLLSQKGLGIIGGNSVAITSPYNPSSYIDYGETLTITFSQPVKNLLLDSTAQGFSNVDNSENNVFVDGFDINNNFIGVTRATTSWWGGDIVENYFSGTPLSKVIFTARNSALTLGNLSYTIFVPEPVGPIIPTPEPSELDLLREQVNILTDEILLLNEMIQSLQVIITTLNQIIEQLVGIPLPPIPPVVNFPIVEITEPRNGQIFTQGDIVILSATVNDVEDGENLEIQWQSHLLGSLGAGNGITVNMTEIGWDVISATVVDSDSNVMTDDITIQVWKRGPSSDCPGTSVFDPDTNSCILER